MSLFPRARILSIFLLGCLSLALTATCFADGGEITTEVIWLKNHKEKYEVTKRGNDITGIKSTIINDDGTSVENETIYNEYGEVKYHGQTTYNDLHMATYVDILYIEYDEKGRQTHMENRKRDTITGAGYVLTADREYTDGVYTEKVTMRDNNTGKVKTEQGTKTYGHPQLTKKNPFEEEYKRIKAAAEEEARGKAAAAQRPGYSAVPAAPGALTPASTTPRLLQGAYVSVNLGVGLTSAASMTPSFGKNFFVTRERDDVVEDLPVKSTGSLFFPGNVNPSVIGGFKLGQYGCPFIDNPIMSHFGWCFDLSYQRYSLSQQSGTFQRTSSVSGDVFSQGVGTAALQGDGSLFTLAFLVNARYGFLPTPEIPFGALQPYVGVGPALVVNRFDPKVLFTSFNGHPGHHGLDFNGETSVNLGLAAEAGLRYYPIQHVFLDLSYRYLHARPDFSFTSKHGDLKVDNTINNSAVRVGVGYAF
jgi:opacity protein-like surface antigen